jgi:hypothetical protein
MTDSSTDWKRKPLYQNCGDAYRKHVRPDARHIDAGIDDFRRPVRSLSRGTKIKEILRNRESELSASGKKRRNHVRGRVN